MRLATKSTVPGEFIQRVEHDRCIKCKRCVMGCGFSALDFTDRVVSGENPCVACHFCTTHCPQQCIHIERYPHVQQDHDVWSVGMQKRIVRQAESGGVLLSAMGNDRPWSVLWDNLLLDACQVTNPSIDPLREPMELRTYLGRKPDRIELEPGPDGKPRLKTRIAPQLRISTPIIFAGMSLGSISLNAQKSIAMAARKLGTIWNTGEGGLHEDLQDYADCAIVQCASGRFGVHEGYLQNAAAVEIKIGQGAKPGIGGHLPGRKVSSEIAETRMVPVGSDALSPAPHHDIYSIEDLRQLIYALKETTQYTKPIGVKIAAVHNVGAIASGIVRAGADYVYLDGFRGGTGAAPTVIRDNVGIPVEIALATVDERLRRENIRHEASVIVAGSIRCSADVAKAIALGADAVAIGTAALITLGCHVCQQCHTGNCSWGITSQRPELTRRLDPAVRAEMVANLVEGWTEELKEILGALGVNAVESLRGSRDRLRGVNLTRETLDILGVKHAGE
jgi:glutamate synthase domain-containing protein 2